MNIADPSAEDADTAAISTSGEMQAESEGSESGNDLLDETPNSQAAKGFQLMPTMINSTFLTHLPLLSPLSYGVMWIVLPSLLI